VKGFESQAIKCTEKYYNHKNGSAHTVLVNIIGE
jgi:hypothetical protein